MSISYKKLLLCSSALLMGVSVMSPVHAKNLRARHGYRIERISHRTDLKQYHAGEQLMKRSYSNIYRDGYDLTDLLSDLSHHPKQMHENSFIHGFKHEFSIVSRHTYNNRDRRDFDRTVDHLVHYSHTKLYRGYVAGLCDPDDNISRRAAKSVSFARGYMFGQSDDSYEASNSPEDRYQGYIEIGGRVPMKKVTKITPQAKAYLRAEHVLNHEYLHASTGNLEPYERKSFTSLHIPNKYKKVYNDFFNEGVPSTQRSYASAIYRKYPLHKIVIMHDGGSNGILLSRANDDVYRKMFRGAYSYLSGSSDKTSLHMKQISQSRSYTPVSSDWYRINDSRGHNLYYAYQN